MPVRIPTRAFGTVAGEVVLPATGDGIDWSRALVFPGLAAGERLRRVTKMPARATLLARDRTVLAKGDDRSSPSLLAPAGRRPAGPDPARAPRGARPRSGCRPTRRSACRASSGSSTSACSGRRAASSSPGARVLKRTTPHQAPAVRTTISLPVEQAAVTALGARVGGVVALQPRTGEVLAFAGIAFSGLQPPGSTFKMITTTGALEAGITNPQKTYPVQQKAVLEGVDLENANGEYCGGSLVVSFAKSCNSVFAPLGVQLGAKRLVATAERYGFNAPPDIAGAAESTIPAGRRDRRRPGGRAPRPSGRAACRRRRCRWRRSRRPSACAGADRT